MKDFDGEEGDEGLTQICISKISYQALDPVRR